MISQELDQRLAAIEQRLTRIESHFRPVSAPPKPRPQARPQPAPLAESTDSDSDAEGPTLVTSLLGWGGAIALVLAAAYLIRLGIDSGWLTPMRQVAMAVIAGLVLIAAGFRLRALDRRYAGLLPAGGIAILFLATYGAHHYYGFIDATVAAAAVIGICLASLWLCSAFQSDLYALFAVAGSYSAPFLLSSLRGSLTDLVIYYSAWGAVFSVFAIWHGRRLIYLLALYLGLIGFDIIGHANAPLEWVPALVFQTAQFVIFGVATVMYSIRRKEPLDGNAALGHLPPLLLFYFLQYTLLNQHMPQAAPWIAVGSAAVVAALYGIARASLAKPLPGGEFLLWSYVALVLFHAGYIESVPKHWAPWVAFILLPVVALVALRRIGGRAWPVYIAVVMIFLINYLRVILDTDLQGVAARPALAVAYAIELYLAYWFTREKREFAAVMSLYAGHISAMTAALHLLDTRIFESTVWAILALACLGVAWVQRDRLLGQSSLLLFGATAAKVMLYDLSGAPPVARIISLVVLGVAFYAGGLLYQRIDRAVAPA